MDREVTEKLATIESEITIDGHTFAIKQIFHKENSQSTDLIFLHEGLGCIELWRDFPESICASTGLNGIVYDRLGHGKSGPLPHPRTPSYLHDEALKYLPRILEKTNCTSPLFIGHSDGGTIALLFAAYHPQKTAGLITEAAHIFVEDITIKGIQTAIDTYESGKLRNGLAKYHADKTDALFYGWAHTWLSSEFRSWNIKEELKTITSPAFIIQGEDDEYGTEAQVDGIVTTIKGKARKRMVPDCGHVPHFQARSVVSDEINSFIHSIVDR